MKKVVILLLVVGFFGLETQAQIFQLGARAGVGRADFTVNEDLSLDGVTVTVRPAEPNTAFHVGAYTRFKILGFYVQPELLYTSHPSTIAFTNQSTSEEIDVQINWNRLDIPVLVGIKLGPVRINAGPMFSATIGSDDDNDDVDFDVAGTSFGYQYGIGLDLGKFLIDLKGEGSFDEPIQSISGGGDSFSLNGGSRQVLLSVGYRIL